jgi:hypothetical protein
MALLTRTRSLLSTVMTCGSATLAPTVVRPTTRSGSCTGTAAIPCWRRLGTRQVPFLRRRTASTAQHTTPSSRPRTAPRSGYVFKPRPSQACWLLTKLERLPRYHAQYRLMWRRQIHIGTHCDL